MNVERPHRRSSGLGSWLADHPVDVALAAIVGIAFAHLLRITANGYFYGDDWGLIQQSGSLRGMLQPYNDHLSVTILVVYRVLIEVFGFVYGPFRMVGLLCLMAVPVALYLATRRVLGPPLAAAAALTTMGFSDVEVRPATLNHYLVLVGGIGCAAALNRGRRADWLLAAALGLSLSAAGGGVAVAVAGLIHNACVRPPRRRWLAVLAPLALWGAWWLAEVRGNQSRFRREMTHGEALGYARDIAWTAFDHLGLGHPVLAAVVVMAFVGYGVWRLRQGLDASANLLAWATALAVWCSAVGYSRGPLTFVEGDPQTGSIQFRYQLVALGFVLLALIPRRRIRWPTRFPLATDRRWLAAAAGLVLLVGVAGGAAMLDRVNHNAAAFERGAASSRALVTELELDPDGIPDAEVLRRYGFLGLRAGEVRSLLDRYGHPHEATAPGPPGIIRNATAGDGQATVSWTAPASNGRSAVTAYVVTPYVGFASRPSRTFSSTATTQTLTGLTNGLTYRFRVQAINAIGTGRASAATNPVTPEVEPE